MFTLKKNLRIDYSLEYDSNPNLLKGLAFLVYELSMNLTIAENKNGLTVDFDLESLLDLEEYINKAIETIKGMRENTALYSKRDIEKMYHSISFLKNIETLFRELVFNNSFTFYINFSEENMTNKIVQENLKKIFGTEDIIEKLDLSVEETKEEEEAQFLENLEHSSDFLENKEIHEITDSLKFNTSLNNEDLNILIDTATEHTDILSDEDIEGLPINSVFDEFFEDKKTSIPNEEKIEEEYLNVDDIAIQSAQVISSIFDTENDTRDFIKNTDELFEQIEISHLTEEEQDELIIASDKKAFSPINNSKKQNLLNSVEELLNEKEKNNLSIGTKVSLTTKKFSYLYSIGYITNHNFFIISNLIKDEDTNSIFFELELEEGGVIKDFDDNILKFEEIDLIKN